jgi:hypothetical protein
MVMNKRIQELAEQATTYIDPSANDGVCWHFDKEKFAELIVQESIKQLLEWKNEPFPFDENTAAWILKEHFGIKQ